MYSARVIHSLCAWCSAGVGRTGVFITLSIVLERMRFEGVVDMFQTVNMLRMQRPFMVQSEVFQSAVAQSLFSRHTAGWFQF